MPIITSIESGSDFSVHSKPKDILPSEDIAMRQIYPNWPLQHTTPQALGARLWSTYRILAKRYQQVVPPPQDGTTASTTIVHGNTIITATLSDTVLFVAAWNTQDEFIGVKQLSRLHILSSDAEAKRIQDAGVNQTLSQREIIKNQQAGQVNLQHGPIIYCQNDYGQKRLLALGTPDLTTLALPRAIGDYCFKPVVIADANIDVTTIPSLLKQFNVKAFGTLLLITTSDGFTDAAIYNNNTYEDYLTRSLKRISFTFSKTNEKTIAEHLVNYAGLSSYDDITVSIQAIVKQNKRTDFNGLLGIYDGHGGNTAATFVAKNVPLVLNELLALSEEEYAANEESINLNQQNYDRDNLDSYRTVLQETEEARIASVPVHAINRMQFMLQLTLVVLVSVGIAASIKMGTTKRLLELFFDKNNCRAHSTFSLLTAVCLLFSVNGANTEESEPLDPTVSYKY